MKHWKIIIGWLVIVVVLAWLMIQGCVTAKYNPETRAMEYFRIGNQEFNGFEAVLPDGSYITFEHQKSEARILAEIIERLLAK